MIEGHGLAAAQGVFVTGTDTEIGKTRIALGLIAAAAGAGLRVAGMKPVATGCVRSRAGLRNEDALRLQAASLAELRYEDVNPYAFEPAVSPHIAAAEAGAIIRADQVRAAAGRISTVADLLVVEGVGGWEAPLAPNLAVSDLAVSLGYAVVLVVGLRLGCLSHAVLTADAIRRRRMVILGWVANQVDPHMDRGAENIGYLRERLAAPLLGTVPYMAQPDPERVATHLRQHWPPPIVKSP